MAPTKSVKRRTRSGCLTCRDRHMKCDESLPVCQNCIKSQRKCYRGTRLNFIQYSFYNPNTPLNTANFHLLDQSITIAGLYNGKKLYKPYLHLHTEEDLKYSDEIFKSDCENSGTVNFDEEKYEVSHSDTPRPRSTGAGSAHILSKPSSMKTSPNLGKRPQSAEATTTSTIAAQADNANAEGEAKHATAPEVHQDYSMGQPQDPQGAYNDVQNSMSDKPSSVPASDFNDSGSVSRSGTGMENTLLTEELMHTFQIPELTSDVQNAGYFNIQNFLLKPKYEFEPPNLSSSKIIFDNPNFEFDIKSFIKLLDQEKYYWFLDLFNELNIWKSMIPSYCLDLIKQEDPTITNTFLINCLLNSCQDALADQTQFENSLALQLQYCQSVINLPVTLEHFKYYEILMVSVTLNLLALLNKLSFLPEEHFTDRDGSLSYNKYVVIFNNQVKLFNRLIYRFHKLSGSKLKKFKSMIFISCVHSIIILKYMIVKRLNERGIHNAKNHTGTSLEFDNNYGLSESGQRWEEDLSQVITYDVPPPSSEVVVAPIMELNRFEIDNLNNNFINFDFSQIHNDFYSISNSTSLKLRKLMWAFVKLDHIKTNPDSKSFDLTKIGFDVKFNISMNGKMIVFPNDKLTLLVLMSNYLNKVVIKTPENQLNLDKETTLEESIQNIDSIFEVIQNSLIQEQLKSFWMKYFNWISKSL